MSRLAFHLLALAFVALAGVLLADNGDKPAAGKPAAERKELKSAGKIAVTPEREAAVMTFVQRNHPELAELLTHLKANQPRGYEQAIRDLHRTTERLASVQERDLALYELEAKAWTAQSRVQLLAARLRMGESEMVRKELREALGVQADARLAVLKHQRGQAAERMAKMDGEISKLENSRDEVIEKQMQALQNSLPSRQAAKNPGNKPQLTGNTQKDNKPAAEKRPGAAKAAE
jgi:hypothetical protein